MLIAYVHILINMFAKHVCYTYINYIYVRVLSKRSYFDTCTESNPGVKCSFCPNKLSGTFNDIEA